ncbi:ASCH domain-containing protein [Achromobacter sp.]|uniref:ASCH domain-containing protein n=1 Tax=Achromobacter sp. TaxID=134375 RepID=UPI0028A96D2A|nr:ASCH domain-containing protein [Achromobacter sp.]
MKPPAPYENAVTFQFGDSPELADELLALVLAGTKTATCGALHHFNDKEPVPAVGRRDVVLDGLGRPACVIETTSVLIQRFDQVDEAFALAEGEGPYDAWREAHVAYFERNGGYAPDMMLVCERFRVVEVFDK